MSIMSYQNYSVLASVYIKENPEYLRRSIDSILNQTFPTDDFVIVKDGPLTEELSRILEDYTSKYPCIHLCGYEKNRGLGAALNYGLKHCKNELVARMDTDDIALPYRCEKEVAEFNSNIDLSIVGGDIILFSEDENKCDGVKKMPTTHKEIYAYGKKRNPFNHPTVMYKKSEVIKAGGYNETHRGEDFALFTLMLRNGVVAANVPEPLLKYRSNTNQMARRTSLSEAKVVLDVVWDNYKHKYAGLTDVLVVAGFQLFGLIVPKSLVSKIYRVLFLK